MFWYWDLWGGQSERLYWTGTVLDIPGEMADRCWPVACVLRGLLLQETGAVEAGDRSIAEGIELGSRLGALDDLPGRTGGCCSPRCSCKAPGPPGDAGRTWQQLSGWERGMTLLLLTAQSDGDLPAAFARLEVARREFETLGGAATGCPRHCGCLPRCTPGAASYGWQPPCSPRRSSRSSSWVSPAIAPSCSPSWPARSAGPASLDRARDAMREAWQSAEEVPGAAYGGLRPAGPARSC